MNWLLFAVIPGLAIVGGSVGAWYAPRLFPMYRKGTPLLVPLAGERVRVAYVGRSSIGYHDVRILPGDYLGWDGRLIKARSRDIRGQR